MQRSIIYPKQQNQTEQTDFRLTCEAGINQQKTAHSVMNKDSKN